MKYFLVLFCLLSLNYLSAQKKIIDHTAYNSWKRIGDIQLSNDGSYSVYTIKPLQGDGWLFLVNNSTGKTDSFPRGINPVFTSDSKTLLFKIHPGFDTLRNCELNKMKKDKWPKDSLGILLLAQDSLIKIPKVKEILVAQEGGRFAYLSHDNKETKKEPAGKKKKKKKKKKKGDDKKEEPTSDGKLLVYADSGYGNPTSLINVSAYEFSESGNKLAYVTHLKNKVDSSELHILDLNDNKKEILKANFADVASFSFDKKEAQLAYVSSMDTIAEGKVYQLRYTDLANNNSKILVDTVNKYLDNAMSVSKNRTPYFSVDGKRIYFGISDKPQKEVKDTLLESEKAKLDLWHWRDNRLQPQQLVELQRDQKSSYLSVFDLNTNSFIILESDSLKVRHNSKNKSEFALAYNRRNYEYAYNWEYPNRVDAYRVNVVTGETVLLGKALIHQVELSPKGDFYTYFNEKAGAQFLVDIRSRKEECITCAVKDEWLEDLNGMPMSASPLGIIGWEKPKNGDPESALYVQSNYDIYRYNFTSKKLEQMTPGVQAGGKKIRRYRTGEWSSDSLYFEWENNYVTGFLESDKSMTFYRPYWDKGILNFEQKHQSAHDISGLKKAKNADQFLFQLSSLQDYPDAYLNTWNKAATEKRISFANRQQSDYNWATVELTSWKSYSGLELQGLVYKPENFDPNKKYPLMVYFYELYSDEIHNHYAPKPTASIIHPTEYASAGYIVLIPDIRYQPGKPAKGAYDCIMSATDHVLKKYACIDSTRMGLQGQSWGGYQTAQLITMTKRYKAAMAGAPVGNMFSAYGGIRWGSGLNRQFQYERSQSRIGKTIWDAPELYVENSPLFHLPKVQTPLLIMANDADGAVPWYQGIELFTGLKRLNKPVWLLNYNGDDHNLTKAANKMDLSIRMRQFFDHYLLDKPAPVWLIDGLPAVDKGKKYALDYK